MTSQPGPVRPIDSGGFAPSGGMAVGDRGYQARVLLVATAVALLVNYVETMVIPGVPVIQKDFSTTPTIASWITSAFLVVGSAAAPLFGRLGDKYGKKRMVLVSLAFYTTGVGAAGFSPSIYFLILSRAVQGLGFAIAPLSLAIITDTYPREKVAPAQGIISATFSIGAAAGLVVGSYVVQEFGWQYAFHSAFVLSVILLLLVWRVIRRDSPTRGGRVDYLGATVLMTGVSLLLVFATEGPSLGWLGAAELALLVPGIVLAASFFVIERGRPEPLIRLNLLRVRNVLVGNLLGIISGMVMFLLFFAVVYYAELPVPFGLGVGIIAAGLIMAPATLAMLAIGPFVGRAVSRFGPKPVLFASGLVMIAGMVLFILNRSSSADVVVDMIFSLVGVVCTIIPIVNMVSMSLPAETMAVGLGINTMLRNLGGAVGPVVATVVMASFTAQSAVTGQGVPASGLPSAIAFDLIFAIGIVLSMLVIGLASASRNYTFEPGPQGGVAAVSPSPRPATAV